MAEKKSGKTTTAKASKTGGRAKKATAKSGGARAKKTTSKTAAKSAKATSKSPAKSASKNAPSRNSKNKRHGILFTGFPGFIGRRLVEKLLPVWPDAEWYLLVLPAVMQQAEDEVADIVVRFPDAADKLHIVPGDISLPQFGLKDETAAKLKKKISHAFHLAAVYHLSVPKKVAYKVNVDGTVHVLDFLEECPHFRRFEYVSTCFVSGKRVGLVREEELEMGQGFKNFYEETKFRAEVEVRKRMSKIPTIIIRPGIVLGDSATGETAKYDGPYYIMKLLKSLPSLVPLPSLGKMAAYVNLVPVDYIINAAAALVQHPEAVGRTFHLADPRPLTAAEIFRMIADHFEMRVLPLRLPGKALEALLARYPKVGDTIGLPAELLTYFNHDARFDTTNTRMFLEPMGINCPYLPDYFDKIFGYFMSHPEIGASAKTGDNPA